MAEQQPLLARPRFFSTVLALIGIAQTAGGVIAGIVGLVGKLGDIGTSVTSFLSSFGVSATSFGALSWIAIIAVAVTTAVVIIVWAWQSYNALCGQPPFGALACVTGVINSVTPGFSQWYSGVVGFASNQPQIDVVVKSAYWSWITFKSPPTVLCAACTNCPPSVAGAASIAGGTPGCSPLLVCVYHDPEVCGAAQNSAIGATVGAALGAVGGTIAAIAIMGAVGCGLTAVFSWICLIILAIVLIIVILIVVLAALIGSAIGAAAARGGFVGTITTPGGQTAITAGTATLVAGTYVSVVGNLAQLAAASGANALWFVGWVPNANGMTVDDATAANNSGTTAIGMSTGKPPFCFTDPDANIPASMDICPAPPPMP